MIYSKPRNFIFLRVPKTASTSMQQQILECVPKSDLTVVTFTRYEKNRDVLLNPNLRNELLEEEENDKTPKVPDHLTLRCLIHYKVITEKDLETLNVYGVMREPIDRIISAAHHLYYSFFPDGTTSNDLAVAKFLEEFNEFRVQKQTNWLMHNNKPINKIFRYDQVHLLMKELCGHDSLMYNHRSEYRKNKTTELSLELQQECQKLYSEDFALWESLQPPQP